jgi:C_GCAxxG_C_C family probable redox protein
MKYQKNICLKIGNIMKLKLTLEEAKKKVLEYMSLDYHCGPSVLKTMLDAYGLKDDLLWAGTVFRGGIAGQQQCPCGAVSGSSIALGLRHRTSAGSKEKKEKAREAACNDAAELVKSFQEKYGAVTCIGLLGVDFADEAAIKIARENNLLGHKCLNLVQFAIEKLYEMEKERS